jgi:ABC-type transport system substrate-binding protein
MIKLENKKASIAILTLILALSITANTRVAQSAKGPRSDDLVFKFYATVDQAYVALKAGEVDLLGYIGWSVGLPLHDGEQVHYDLYQDAIADSNIQLAPIQGNDVVGFDFNNNCTISWYPGIQSPMSYLSFRQALAHLVDKDYIVDVFKGGLADRIDVPIPRSQRGWWNPAVTGAAYPYPYNSTVAAALFAADGFVQGTTPNPYFDPVYPSSAMFIRTYPIGHPQKPGQDLDPIIFKLRIDDNPRHSAAHHFISEMQKSGIPVQYVEEPKESLFHQVMGERNYHIYTSGWTVKKVPIYLYKLYHSDFWHPYGANYVTGVDCSGSNNYPALDIQLQQLWHSPNFAGSIGPCNVAQQIMVNQCISVWLYSSRGYVPYRDLLGVVNMDGYGPVNKYTFLNAYKTDDSPIRVGLANAPISLNVMYSDWICDWLCLDRIYSHLLNEAPYNLAADQAWIAKDWEIGTWFDPQDALNKTKVTYWLREDVYWVRPITGDLDYQFTAHDVEFSIWFAYALDDCWHYFDVKDVHHTRIINDWGIEVYFNTSSYWAYHWIGEELPLIPKYLWLDNFCNFTYASVTVDRPYVPCEKFLLPAETIVQVEEVYLDGVPLTEGIDYNIVAKDGSHNWFHWLIPGLPDQLLEIYYWTHTWFSPSPRGYTPGDSFYWWGEKMEGCGMYYITDLIPGVGGYMTLKRNRFYFLETPLLGEIDFQWRWTAGPKPRNGYFEINIFDIVLAAVAYGTQGHGIPDPKWFPGADVAPRECEIDIFDIVTIAAQYGNRWGHS